MAEKLDTADGFSNTLAEVEVLLREAEEAAPGKPLANEQKFSVMNKSALLLMTGKFEAFLEGAAEDFLFAVNQTGARFRHLPIRLLAEHSVRTVQELEKRLNSNDLDTVKAICISLGRQWTDQVQCASLNVSCKFNYGKHGGNEVIRLFKRIGIEDVFERITVLDVAVEPYEGNVAPSVDVKGMVNSLTGLRNNILHQDETPNLTPTELRNQSIALQRFAAALIANLQGIIDSIEANVLAEGLNVADQDK